MLLSKKFHNYVVANVNFFNDNLPKVINLVCSLIEEFNYNFLPKYNTGFFSYMHFSVESGY